MINHLVTNRNKLLMTMLVVLLLALNLVYSADFPNLKDINTNEFNSSSVSVPIQQGTMLAAGDDSTVTNDSGRQNAAGKKISLNSTDSATIRKVYTTDSVIALMGKKAGFSAEQGSKFIDMIIEVESSEEKLLDINDVLSVRIREANSDTWAVPDHIAVENADHTGFVQGTRSEFYGSARYHVVFAVEDAASDNSEDAADAECELKRYEIEVLSDNGSNRYYIQSALSVADEEKRQQEINSLKRVADSFKKIVVVKDAIIPWHDEDGIYYVGIEQFLLDENCINM